jgi:uncharacterized membrane protein
VQIFDNLIVVVAAADVCSFFRHLLFLAANFSFSPRIHVPINFIILVCGEAIASIKWDKQLTSFWKL